MAKPKRKVEPEVETSKRLRKQPAVNTAPVFPEVSVGPASTEEHAKNQGHRASSTTDELNALHGLTISGLCPFLNDAPREIRDIIYGYVVPAAPFLADRKLLNQLRPPRRWKRPFSVVEVAKYLLTRTAAPEYDETTTIHELSNKIQEELAILRASRIQWTQVKEERVAFLLQFRKDTATLFDVSKQIREESVAAFLKVVQLGSLNGKEMQHLFKAISSDGIAHLRYINVNWLVRGTLNKWEIYGYRNSCMAYLNHKEHKRGRTPLDEDIRDITDAFVTLAKCQGLHEIRLNCSDHPDPDRNNEWHRDSEWLNGLRRRLVERFERSGLVLEDDEGRIFMQVLFKRLMVESFERKGLKLEFRDTEPNLGEAPWRGTQAIWWDRRT